MAKNKFEIKTNAELVEGEDGVAGLDLPIGVLIEAFMQMDPDVIREVVGEFAVRRAAAFFTAVGEALDSAVDDAERKRAEAKPAEDA